MVYPLFCYEVVQLLENPACTFSNCQKASMPKQTEYMRTRLCGVRVDSFVVCLCAIRKCSVKLSPRQTRNFSDRNCRFRIVRGTRYLFGTVCIARHGFLTGLIERTFWSNWITPNTRYFVLSIVPVDCSSPPHSTYITKRSWPLPRLCLFHII